MTEQTTSIKSFVAANPFPLAKPDTLRSSDAADAVRELIRLYGQQQAAIITQSTPLESSPYSSSSELAERRATARLYLAHQTIAASSATAGIVAIAWIAGMASTGLALASWIGVTGIAALLLSASQHRREQRLSPENIELERMEYSAALAEFEAETRRQLLMGELELRAYHAAQIATESERLARRDSDRLAWERLTYQQKREDARVQVVQSTDGLHMSGEPNCVGARLNSAQLAAVASDTVQGDIPAVIGGPTASDVIPDVNHDVRLYRSIAAETLALYNERRGDVSSTGQISRRLSFSARGDLEPGDRQRVMEVLSSIEPKLFFQAAGNRWHLNIERYRTGKSAISALSSHWL